MSETKEIIGWGPPEETDYDLRRRISLNRKKAPKTPSTRSLERAQREAIDGSWGMRKQYQRGKIIAGSRE